MLKAIAAAGAAIRNEDRTRASSTFGGAMTGRLVADFNAGLFSPNQEIWGVAQVLRARARKLARDNSHASGFLNELANNVIGPDGILLQAKVKTKAGQSAKATNDEIERAWREWGMPENCTADGAEDWVDFQKTVIRTIAMDGEVFIRKLKYFDGSPFAFALQIIDADLVRDDLNRARGDGQNEIRFGIELNEWGRPVAYHIWSRYLGDQGKRDPLRIPADEIIHKFVRYRANQVRGVTWFAPVLIDLHYLDGYEFAELTAARVSAAKMGFIKNVSEAALAAYKPPKAGEPPRQFDVSPGLFEELMPGQEVEMFDPKHPSSAFKDFTKAILRGVARGLNMAYTTLTGDLEAVNYSSIRAGLLSERDHYRGLQRWLGIHVHRRIYRDWLGMALLANQLRVDTRLAADYYAVEWKPRGWKWVDPVNDLTAAALAIALGLDSRQRLAAEQGRDFEDIVDELAHEMEYADAMGVPIDGAGAAPTDTNTDEPTTTNQRTDIAPTDDSETDDSADARARAMERNRRVRITALRAALATLEKRRAA